MATTTANTAEFQDGGKPVAQPVYVVDSNGNPTTLATAQDGAALSSASEVVIGLYNSANGTLDRLRDAGSVGDGVTIGLIGAAQYLFNGGSFDRLRTPSKFVSIQNIAVTAGTPASIWTPVNGKKFHLMGFMVSLSVAGYIIFEDGAGGGAAEFIRTPAMATGIGLANPANFGNGYTSTAANNILKMDVSASGNINGFLFGTDEF